MVRDVASVRMALVEATDAIVRGCVCIVFKGRACFELSVLGCPASQSK